MDANPSSSPGPNSYVKTANDGSFDLGVFGGDWMLQVDCNDAFQFGLVSPSLQLTVTNGVDRTNLTLTLMQSTATITVVATNQQGQTVQVSGYASLTPNGNYNGGCGQPSPNGLQFKVFNGTWSIGLQDNITSQGYDNPGWQNVSVNGHDVTVYFALYPLGQTPSHINLANMNGQLQFFITGSSQLRYRLEYTTNLANPNAWVPLTTNTTGGGVMMYFENIPSGTAGGRFYRTVVTP